MRLNEVWNSYQTTIECLKVVARVVKRKDISVLDKANFIGAPVEEAAGRVSSSTEHAGDYVILALWTLFERYLFLHLQKESKRMLQVSTTSFTQETQQKIENKLEYWCVNEVLDLFKMMIGSNLIGQAKQVKQYKDWVAHRNPKKPSKTNVPLQTAYVVLSTVVWQLEAHPDVRGAVPRRPNKALHRTASSVSTIKAQKIQLES